MANDNSADADDRLSVQEAFIAMSRFLDQFYARAGDDFLTLMTDVTIEPDGMTLDPAAWDDWRQAASEARAGAPARTQLPDTRDDPSTNAPEGVDDRSHLVASRPIVVLRAAFPAADLNLFEIVAIELTGAGVTLWFSFSPGGRVDGGIAFESVRASRWSADLYSSPAQIESSWDQVVEVKPSAWVDELLARQSPAGGPYGWVLRHFMLYVDGDGCYEVVAESCQLVPGPTGG